MSDSTIRVYVNSQPIDLAPSATVYDAVAAASPDLGAALLAGQRAVTDSRGLPIAADAQLYGGAILRVVSSRVREQ